MNRKFLLLVQEEYPNPCDSELYFDRFVPWIWGRWWKITIRFFTADELF
jgi:hypothetical protein